jgi:hypothetical protein
MDGILEREPCMWQLPQVVKNGIPQLVFVVVGLIISQGGVVE